MKHITPEDKSLRKAIENSKLFDKKLNSEYLKKIYIKENKAKSKIIFIKLKCNRIY